MAGLVPAIHAVKPPRFLGMTQKGKRHFVLQSGGSKPWMAGTSPAMTSPWVLPAAGAPALR
jgi:hypothetical protein